MARSEISTDRERHRYQISGDSPFRDELRKAAEDVPPTNALKAVARRFAASPQFVATPDALALNDAYDRAYEAALAFHPEDDENLAERLAGVFDVESLTELIASPDFASDRGLVHDSLIAAKILGSEREQDVAALVRIARTISLVENVKVGGSPTPSPRRDRSAAERPHCTTESFCRPIASRCPGKLARRPRR